jgi:invasion protein IalB
VMRLSLPHGISLPDGVDVSINDDKPVNHVISVADQNGSYSQFELGANMIVGLQSGAILNIGVKAANGNPVQFQLSLKGFGAAFAKI